jgi:hypothetical protein
MSAALVTALCLSLVGLVLSAALGYRAGSQAELLQHATVGVFTTLLALLTHSMTMFYLIGKGRAIRDALAEGGLPGDLAAEVARARRPVFSMGSLASAVTMAAAIVGAGVDTKVLPPAVHAALAFAAIAAHVAAMRAAFAALATSGRIVAEVNRRLGA